MTREETLKVLAVLKAAYPSFYRDLSRRDAEAAVDLWASLFTVPPLYSTDAAGNRGW